MSEPVYQVSGGNLLVGDVFRLRTWPNWYELMSFTHVSNDEWLYAVVKNLATEEVYEMASRNRIYSVRGPVSEKRRHREPEKPEKMIVVRFTQTEVDALVEAFEDDPDWSDVMGKLLGAMKA